MGLEREASMLMTVVGEHSCGKAQWIVLQATYHEKGVIMYVGKSMTSHGRIRPVQNHSGAVSTWY